MAPLSQNGASFAASDPNAILNECRDIGQGIDGIETNLNQLRMLQDRSLNETDSSSSGTSRELDNLSAETMSMYRELTERVRKMKSTPDAQTPKNAPQVGRIDRRLKNAIQQYQEVEADFRKRMHLQMERQYLIVRPNAPKEEVDNAVADMAAGGQPVFQNAMLNSTRQGEAKAVLSAVQDRHRELQKIEQAMIELAQLFQDMDTLIVQQEAAVVQIEQKGEEVVENLDKGNQEIEVAVDTARKTRRKKWYCVGISGTHPYPAAFPPPPKYRSKSPRGPPANSPPSPYCCCNRHHRGRLYGGHWEVLKQQQQQRQRQCQAQRS